MRDRTCRRQPELTGLRLRVLEIQLEVLGRMSAFAECRRGRTASFQAGAPFGNAVVQKRAFCLPPVSDGITPVRSPAAPVETGTALWNPWRRSAVLFSALVLGTAPFFGCAVHRGCGPLEGVGLRRSFSLRGRQTLHGIDDVEKFHEPSPARCHTLRFRRRSLKNSCA